MWVRERLGAERVSERRACQVLGQVRSTQRRERQIPDDPVGYARALGHGDLHGEGWKVNPKRVERLGDKKG